MAQGGVHVGDHGGHPAAMVGADGHHELCQLDALVHGFHKGTGAGGHIQQNGVRAGSQLLGHDAGRDERDAAHGGGHIPQGVHLFVCHGDALALADDRQTDAVDLCKELFLRQGRPGARHALHLVDGAAGVAQTAAAHLGDLDPAGCHDGGDHQRGLVAHAAGGVLVHLDARNGRKVHHDAAVGHHVGKLCRLFVGHAAQVHSHHPGSHLIIGHLTGHITVDDALQLFTAVGAAVAFFGDQIINAHNFTLLSK